MTQHEYRLGEAARRWLRGQLEPASDARRRWLVRHTRQILRRAKRVRPQLEAR